MADLEFELKIITPERIMYNKPVRRVIFQTTEGEMAVLKGHIPLTAIIESSVFHILSEGDSEQEELILALHEGFVEIRPDRVSILTESAEWPDEIDTDRAENARKRAEERLKARSKDIDVARAELALRRSLIRLEIAKN